MGMTQPEMTHPMTEPPAADERRCFYSGVPALARQGRNGYVDVTLLKDRGYGSMFIHGTAPGNVTWVDSRFDS